MAALLERSQSGQGQVIDSNMVEGAAYVGSWLFANSPIGRFSVDSLGAMSPDIHWDLRESKENLDPVWGEPRGHNILDSGSHFYETYRTLDGGYMSVGAIEPQFYQRLLEGLGVTDDELPQFEDFDKLKEKLADIFSKKTRAEWTEIFGKNRKY